MGFNTTIKCDRCDAERNVPQPGVLPLGWIQVLYAKSQLNVRLEARGTEPMLITLCSWKCLAHKSKEFLAKGEDVDIPELLKLEATRGR